jgi:DNA-binding NtrC family response regulator
MDRASIQERFGIIGSSDAIKHVIDRARQVARTDITVLLQGESGVGKELVAQVVHEISPRRHKPIVIVNCGAIPEGLIESELFGAEKGAYTGSVERRTGYFEEADGSTIFLDEIGEMPKQAQVRLLRVLESGTFSRVGSSQQQQTDARVVAATNKDLGREVKAGRFRKDLYYRLSTVLIEVPPLRERRDDIPELFAHFLHRLGQEYNSPMKKLTEGARELVQRYHWPGNVRELRNAAEQAVVLLRQDEVTAADLRPFLRDLGGGEAPNTRPALMRVDADADPNAGETFRERELLYRALLEMRMEMREMKEQLQSLVSTVGIAVPRDIVEAKDFPARYEDLVVVREASGEETAFRRAAAPAEDPSYGSLIKDVVYEVEPSEETPSREASTGRSARAEVARSLSGDAGTAAETAPRNPPPGLVPAERSAPAPGDASEPAEENAEPASLPTLEEAERELIKEALHRFDGNRRQTARALGISERTLYRKIKDIDEDV